MSEKAKRPQAGPMGGGGPGRGIGMKVEKPKNFGATVKRLFAYMSSRLIAVGIVFVLAITAVIFQIQTPKILGKATT
ncbi:MAG: ABC transporter ATP-binding protein, partial [Enterococcus sp.]|nr:ABC transporter ATP-binding protein [Enterococcus sp.]